MVVGAFIFPEFCTAMRQGRVSYLFIAPLPARIQHLSLSIPSFDFADNLPDLLPRVPDCEVYLPDHDVAVCDRDWVDKKRDLAFPGNASINIWRAKEGRLDTFIRTDGLWCLNDLFPKPRLHDFGACLWLLQNPEVIYTMPERSAAKRENLHRRAKGLRSLRDPNVVYLHKRIEIAEDKPRSTSDFYGPQRSPHVRRAHLRYYKTGKVVEVRASKIHGGGGINYVVRP